MKGFAFKYNTLIVIVFMIFLSASCKIKKYILDEEIVNRSFSENLIEKYENTELPEHLLVDNAILKITNGQQINLNLLVYIKRAESIFVSGKTLGFEIFRCQLTKDSIFFINRIKRNYFFQPYNKLNISTIKEFDIDLLQKFFYTGIYEEDKPTKRKINQTYNFNDSLYFTNKTFPEGNFLMMAYNRYAELENLNFRSYDYSLDFSSSIFREYGQKKLIEATIFYKSDEYNIQIQINNIRYAPYDKTNFNVGNNYNETISLF